jgi:rubrerythrin
MRGGEMMELKGSQTEKNLLAAFAGESQARNRYTYFASAARKEGYEQISALFLETADNEKEHAKLFFSLLKGGETEIVAAYPAGTIGNTAANLKAAADGEKLEWTTLYQNFADIAKKEDTGGAEKRRRGPFWGLQRAIPPQGSTSTSQRRPTRENSIRRPAGASTWTSMWACRATMST